ncbi:hypothetical protein [Micromonospora auratinigra]|uniref:Uncharacterized protein n=1 Tax=Micromonospora auratinigra TaxID=261654 RepID=A0A1A9A8P7_9ACTN|nr:hypothetical protein [Micromonospora auratinigra]SBT52856.1 hypothetical protein GA0070611_5829 [Micromonospora auratinigra]
MRALRVLLVLAGGAAAGYGAVLLRPQWAAAALWLLGGPLVHDLLVAPLVAVVGLAAGRVVRDPVRRTLAGAGLAVTATLLLLAVPLLVRPAALRDVDPLPGLLGWLAALWAGVGLGCLLRRRSGPPRRPVR